MKTNKKYFALYDVAGTGEYQNDILRHEWLTQEEANFKNTKLREQGEDGLIWSIDDSEVNEDLFPIDRDCRELDMDLRY